MSASVCWPFCLRCRRSSAGDDDLVDLHERGVVPENAGLDGMPASTSEVELHGKALVLERQEKLATMHRSARDDVLLLILVGGPVVDLERRHECVVSVVVVD